ncbi:coenzyme F420-0:L-glutamate ligase / coenzyme F420-1:gamma-L-glutamate ligase [Agrococcus baldri]|uniref:Coenzyme F420-0:L-glutamate ligase / coenzyme F420-1:gamma-L-glutamate ligase n=1 Tax=Agrococcus baldri TaxID=153730 RepID=A0AA94HK58_9MICO|nr:coenzyme F420-0:L-glutamate ligase [Agrococcus baldri]SFR98826.1 coenzyme F420-0:L-glutamate ligase / coenzyme F420-1:gamma-L-glutamate ligase [Agrococcus baldri]
MSDPQPGLDQPGAHQPGADLQLWAVRGMGEIRSGDDLPAIIADALAPLEPRDGDVVVVTSKVVSKAEGRIRPADEREQAIDDESVRLVASREHPGGVTRIVEHRTGLVLAAAGIDASNTDDGTILLLPLDSDASARAIAETLRSRFGARVGVIVSDTLGRAWRVGQTDVAIGAAGLRVLEPLSGQLDANGRPLVVTAPAIADEIAGAADLVAGKSDGVPVVLVRGMGRHVAELDEPGATRLVRSAADDMFRLGTDEAWAQGFAAGRASASAMAESEATS